MQALVAIRFVCFIDIADRKKDATRFIPGIGEREMSKRLEGREGDVEIREVEKKDWEESDKERED